MLSWQGGLIVNYMPVPAEMQKSRENVVLEKKNELICEEERMAPNLASY
jgi:hypothetical protein